MNEFEQEVKQDFLVEATQLLNDAEQAFLALESDKHNMNLMNEIFRLAHNLKGTSRAVGFGDVAEFTHEWENLILKLKEKHLEVTDEIVSLLLECNDHVSGMDMDAKFNSTEIIEKIKAALEGKLPTANSEAVVEEFKADEISMDDINLIENFEKNLDMVVAVEEKSEMPVASFIPENKVEEKVIPIQNTATSAKEVKKEANKAVVEDDSIRVSLSRVDTLNNVVGELVILQTVLNQHREEAQSSIMLKSLSQLAKLSKEIQNISMSLRMVPVKSTLQKMQRIVRDTSKALNKKVQLDLIGEETEIDKTVLEYLADPLVHIVRNAVDHGLETTEDRVKAGKSEEGRVSINAFHEGNSLVIEIKDDGKGINHEVIRAKAIEKKVISPNANLTKDELVNLIFHPGFSTKAEVSEISGRGVGMDVVKTNIEKLSGEVKVITELGKGSTFRVVLPLTMAIIEAMVTRVGDEKYVIPLAQVYESLSPTADIVEHVNGVGECLKIRGQVIPLFKISKTLQRNIKEKATADQIAIIVNNNDKSFAVLVDDILHQQQVVIKKLGTEIQNQKGFMGSSILGDGRPAFILDLIELYSGSMKKKKSTFAEQVAA
jgi:two-component system chemotaxis sensor kinase CheA